MARSTARTRAALRLYRAIAAARREGPQARGEGQRSNDHIVVRCLSILAALAHEPGGLLIAELLEHCGTSRSTLYRDLVVLREVGLPIESVQEVPGGPARWRIAPG